VTYKGEHVQLDVLTLDAGASYRVEAPATDEIAVVLLVGEVEWLGVRSARASVFEAPASAAYVPPGAAIDVVASSRSELACVATVAGGLHARGEAFVVTPDDVAVHHRGRDAWTRDVHDVISESMPAQRLLVGETFNAPGGWSSFPPHKHDGTDGEIALEEVYYYRFDKPDGFGFQGLYERDGSERAVLVRDGSVVGIPRGFHPVCAAPGYRLYYLWALAGEERRLTMFEDPAHRWLNAQ